LPGLGPRSCPFHFTLIAKKRHERMLNITAGNATINSRGQRCDRFASTIRRIEGERPGENQSRLIGPVLRRASQLLEPFRTLTDPMKRKTESVTNQSFVGREFNGLTEPLDGLRIPPELSLEICKIRIGRNEIRRELDRSLIGSSRGIGLSVVDGE
jgi:hypothetical protein